MRRFLAILALAGLLTAPALSRTQHVCRYSGEEQACPSETSSPAPILVSEGCCERRQLIALAQMRASRLHDEPTAAPVLLAPLDAVAARLADAPTRRLCALVPRASGPPLFVQHRALLI